MDVYQAINNYTIVLCLVNYKYSLNLSIVTHDSLLRQGFVEEIL